MFEIIKGGWVSRKRFELEKQARAVAELELKRMRHKASSDTGNRIAAEQDLRCFKLKHAKLQADYDAMDAKYTQLKRATSHLLIGIEGLTIRFNDDCGYLPAITAEETS